MQFGNKTNQCVLKFYRVGRPSNVVVTYGRLKLPNGEFRYLKNALRCNTSVEAYVKQQERMLVLQKNDKALYEFLKENYPCSLDGFAENYTEFHSKMMEALCSQYRSAKLPTGNTTTRSNAVTCPKLHNVISKNRYLEFKSSTTKI